MVPEIEANKCLAPLPSARYSTGKTGHCQPIVCKASQHIDLGDIHNQSVNQSPLYIIPLNSTIVKSETMSIRLPDFPNASLYSIFFRLGPIMFDYLFTRRSF